MLTNEHLFEEKMLSKWSYIMLDLKENTDLQRKATT